MVNVEAHSNPLRIILVSTIFDWSLVSDISHRVPSVDCFLHWASALRLEGGDDFVVDVANHLAFVAHVVVNYAGPSIDSYYVAIHLAGILRVKVSAHGFSLKHAIGHRYIKVSFCDSRICRFRHRERGGGARGFRPQNNFYEPNFPRCVL